MTYFPVSRRNKTEGIKLTMIRNALPYLLFYLEP